MATSAEGSSAGVGAIDVHLGSGSAASPDGMGLRRSVVDRTLGPMRAGSQRGSVLALACTAFGCGMLTLPWVLANFGLPMGIALLTFGAVCNFYSLRLLVNLAYATRHDQYSSAVQAAIGPKTAWVLDGMLGVYAWGNIAALMVFLSGFAPMLADALSLPDCFRGGWRFILIIFCFPSLPLSLARSLSALRYPMLVSVLGLVSLGFIIAARSGQRSSEMRQAADPAIDQDWWIHPHMDSWEAVPQGIAMIINAYNCHMSLFTTKQELAAPTPERMGKVLLRATIVQWAFYVVLAVAGALSFGYPCLPGTTPSEEIWCTPTNVLASRHFTGPDATISRALMTYTILLGIPINLHCIRSIVERRCFAPTQSQEELQQQLRDDHQPGAQWQSSLQVHVLLTVGLLGSAALLAVVYSNITNLLGILGGGCASTFMFMLPAIATTVIRSSQWKEPSSPVLGRVVGVSKAGVIAVVILLAIASSIGYFAACIAVVNL